MNADIILQLVLLGTAVALFASDRVRPDAVALGLILVLMLTGQLGVSESLAGFGDPLVLMIAGLFVVGEGLASTGVAHALGDRLLARSGGSEASLLVSLMAVVAALSAFMSSTGAVAVFIPVTLTLARRTGTSPSRLLMPMAFASLLGGMLTLIGTPPNLAVSAELERGGADPFGFFDFAPAGLVVCLGCIAWMVLAGRRGLGGKAALATDDTPTLADLAARFEQVGRAFSLRIGHGSPVVGLTPAALDLGREHQLILLGVERTGRFGREAVAPSPDLDLRAGDLIHVMGHGGAIDELVDRYDLERVGRLRDHGGRMVEAVGLVEILVPPGSALAGKSLADGNLRRRTGLTAVAVRRRDGTLDDAVADTVPDAGDTMLMTGDWRAIRALGGDPQFLVPLTLPRELADVAPARSRAPVSLAVLAAMLLAMTFDVIPAVAAVLLAALAMVAGRCVTPTRAYRSIGWPSLVLIAGMLPLATALERSGAITLVVDGVVGALGGLGPRAVLAGLFLLTAVFSQFISNTATAVLVAPIAALVGQELGVSPRPLLMAVALGASAAFLTPVASPVNTLVMGPGGYRFGDFVRQGLPLVLITLAAAVLLVPLVFPF